MTGASASHPSALDAVLHLLRCPVCGDGLARSGASVRCPAGHSFDIARQGYVSLLTGSRAISGDDPPMVRARQRFLETGGYAPIREAIVELAAPASRPETTSLEVGCGTGYHLAGVLDHLRDARGLGLDSSARAAAIAARSHDRVAVATWDLFRPFPLASGSVDLVLDAFSPRSPAEFHRVLSADGALIVTRPTAGHLAQLLERPDWKVGIDPEKERRLEQALDPFFEPTRTVRTNYVLPLSPEQALDLVSMTPAARHLPVEGLAAGAGTPLPPEVEVSVLTTLYRPRAFVQRRPER
jgi:23S rRNA (guanine745-N1)-methyltransferase